ncbi:MAG TPA: Fe-Mn family superoxide dismutase [Chthonomonadaceae bacterium]|jgi:Fe-Mn family superoxide dismutase|nr:Fe-Mn family superoxide dismutase [Chthonomonadaceae bacterium]
MNHESNAPRMDRRRFLTLGAVTGATALAAVTGIESANAAELLAPQDTPAKGSTPLTINAMPLPEKVFNTAGAGISRKTHEEHYELYKGYVAKVNEIRGKLAGLGVPDPTKANQTYSDIRELKVEYTFALGGVKNHELYFNHLGGKGGAPDGPVAEAINAAFGSYDNWKADLKATGLAGRGWAWLALDHSDGSLFNYIGDAQNMFPVWDATPILGLDVYEHAYFIDFGRNRGKYIDAFFQVIDWDAVNANLKVARAVADAAKAAR